MTIKESFRSIEGEIIEACSQAHRQRDTVQLVAVSKTKSVEQIFEAYQTGQRVFGENKLQELEHKAPALPDDCEWHFIGTIQRNKVRKILAHTQTLHSVDSQKLAETVDRIAGELGIVAHIFLQIHIGDEASKHGFSKQEIHAVLPKLSELRHVKIEGLMCIPPPAKSKEQARHFFKELRDLRKDLNQTCRGKLQKLSMGMSGDFHEAIAEGATHIRIGSSLFGKR